MLFTSAAVFTTVGHLRRSFKQYLGSCCHFTQNLREKRPHPLLVRVENAMRPMIIYNVTKKQEKHAARARA